MSDRLPVLIGTHRYQTEVIGIQVSPHGDVAQVLDTQAEPGEQSLENRGIWKRTASDFVLGAGQQYFDLRASIDSSVSERHRWSRGLKMLGEHRTIELLNSATEQTQVTHAGSSPFHTRAGDRIFFGNSQGVRVSAANDPTSWSTPTGTSGTPRSLTSLNGLAYLQTSTSLQVNSSGSPTVFSTVGSIEADLVLGAAGRLIAMFEHSVWEYSNPTVLGTATYDETGGASEDLWTSASHPLSDGEIIYFTVVGGGATGYAVNTPYYVVNATANTFRLSTTSGGSPIAGTGDSSGTWKFAYSGNKLGGTNIFDHPWSDFRWAGGVSTPVGVYLYGSGGDGRSEIYMLTPVDATGEFAPPYPVGETNEGEVIRSMTEYGGFMFIATTLGLRIAQLNDGGILSIGPLIEIGSLGGLHKKGRFLYATGSLTDSAGAVDDAGLWVFDLKRFTGTLEPAYSQHLAVGATRTDLDGVTHLNDLLVFFADDGTRTEVWVESTTKVASGEIRFGGLTFGTAELMSLSSVELDSDPLPAGATIDVDFYDRINGTKSDLATFTQISDTNHIYRYSEAVTVEEGELAVTLTRPTAATTTPVLRRATVRGIPMVKHSSMLEVPLMLFEEVAEGDDGTQERVDVEAELVYLWSLVDGTAPVTCQIGTLTFLARVKGLVVNPAQGQHIGGGFDDWQGEPGRSFVNGVWAVILETVSDVPFSFS